MAPQLYCSRKKHEVYLLHGEAVVTGDLGPKRVPSGKTFLYPDKKGNPVHSADRCWAYAPPLVLPQECNQMFGYHKQLLAFAREAQMKVRRMEYYAKKATWTAQRRTKDPDLGPTPTMKHDFNRVEQGALIKHAQNVRELLLFLLLMLLLPLMMMMVMVILIMMTFCYCCCRMSLLKMTFAAALLLLLLLLLAAAVDPGTRVPFAGISPCPRQLGVDGGRCSPRHACGRREPTSLQGGQRRVHVA
jgi:hypothetical protein